MKKILLIEDRAVRQKLFTNETAINLDAYTDILDNFIGNDYEELFLQLLADSFSFEKYDMVISHKSAFAKNNATILSTLKRHCQEQQIPLVLFSGGISNNYYDHSDGELLELNSKVFYSQNLKLFLEAYKHQNHNLLMLCYGEKWEANVVANILENLNLFLCEDQEDYVDYNEFVNTTDQKKLEKIEHTFLTLQPEKGAVSLEEIKLFKNSLDRYFENIDKKDITETQHHCKNLLIHNNNVFDLGYFSQRVRFLPPHDDIERYISEEIIPELEKKDFDVLYIKDKLTANYLELAGLQLAYHVRLSESLGEKRFVPIVIISDLSTETLMKLDPIAKLVFTKNVYVLQNNKVSIDGFSQFAFSNLTSSEYQQNFLDLIHIEQPKDYLSHHDISNEWSIYRWAEALHVNSDVIQTNRSRIMHLLYFKYLQALHMSNDYKDIDIAQIQGKGKILYIDDESEKGWNDIFFQLFSKTDRIDFVSLNYPFQDANKFNLITTVKEKIITENPDIVVLDLRLIKTDHEQTDIEALTGIKLLDVIHSINAGIQVIMLTATNKSSILEKLYEHKILGYVKKEHPADLSTNTIENINKFVSLIERGLQRKYLKQIYSIHTDIKKLLDQDIFAKYNIPVEQYEPYWIKLQNEAQSIFDILDGNSENKFLYAMVSIASSLETILTIFVDEKKRQYWDGEACEAESVNKKLKDLFHNKFGYPREDKFGHQNKDIDLGKMISKRNDYLHTRAIVSVSSDEISSWYKKLFKMMQLIQSPPAIKQYNRNNLLGNLQDKFK